METDEERKARNMVATTQLRLALETEDERRVRLEHLSHNPIYILNNLYLILNVAFEEASSFIKLTRTIHFFRTIHYVTGFGKTSLIAGLVKIDFIPEKASTKFKYCLRKI